MREKLTRRWQTCSRRDRLIFVCLGLVMLVLLLWFCVISPLGKRINYLEKRIPELESRLNAMRSQSLAEVRVSLTEINMHVQVLVNGYQRIQLSTAKNTTIPSYVVYRVLFF